MGGLVNLIREHQQRISELRAELATMEAELREAKAALGVVERRRVPERNRGIRGAVARLGAVKAGSTVDLAIKCLRAAGQPVGVGELIKAIKNISGQDVKKATLVSNLSRYVKANDTFTRPSPSTYGLKEFEFEADEHPHPFDGDGEALRRLNSMFAEVTAGEGSS